MKRLYALIVAAALCFPSIGAGAWWQSIQQVGVSAGVSYQGPGDVVSGSTSWESCARVYQASLASTATSLCDLVAVTGGAVVCTLRATSTGFVDLAASYCAGTTPAAACAAASGGSCKVTKAYDQTGTGNHFIQATLASMPALTFSALNGLPGLTFTQANATTINTASISFTQPFSMSGVYKRTSTTNGGNVLAGQGSGVGFGPAGGVADQAELLAPSSIKVAATDNAFHALQAVANSVSSAVIADGTVTSADAGSSNITAVALRLGRSTGGFSLDGTIMEAGIWPSLAMTTGGGSQTALLNANQHSAANGYNF